MATSAVVYFVPFFLLLRHDCLQGEARKRERASNHFPKRDRPRASPIQVRSAPWTMFFYGVENAKKQPAAPSGPDVARSPAEFLFQEVGLRP